jgi:uncharacterized protein YqeY
VIIDQIKSQIKDAMKSRDSERSALLRLVLGTIQQEGDDSDEVVAAIIRKMIKSNNQTVEAVVANGGTASEIHQENALLNSFLPQSMTVEEIKHYLAGKIECQPIGKAMGAAMKILKADGKVAQGADVKKALEEFANEC